MARPAIWDRDSLAYAAFLFKRREGRYPSSSDWLVRGENNPAQRTVFNYFPTWSALVEAAQEIEESCLTSTL